ncbi:MAG: rRNA maturation RNase YbeY [Elusimicrobiales bacterium]|nr:rRNA maturation RNase YbeY [Elusimicrobiales bacterium]
MKNGKKININIIGNKHVYQHIEDLINKLCKKILDKSFKEVYINFIGSNEIKKINSKVFKSNKLTDVITLTYNITPKYKLGEIFISIPQAVKNSKVYTISQETEILILVTHGLLHLVGYDDKTIKDFKEINILTLKNLKKLL